MSNIASQILETLMLVPTLGLYYLIMEKCFIVNKAEGSSMEPTIENSSTLFVNKLLFQKKNLKKGDIIIAQSPIKPNVDICKRILYLEDEQVNGIKIPKNFCWIEGDNKNNSFDSRDHGPLPIYLIKGKVILSFFPYRLFL